MAAHPNKTLLTKTLYKSLLRTVKHYTSKRNGPILSCFLYRSGGTEDDTLHQLEEPNLPAQESKESKQQFFQVSQRDNASAAPMKDEGGDDYDRRTESSSSSSLSLSSWRESNPDIYRYLTVEQARDLSRPYSSLFQQRRKRNNSMQEEESQDFKTTSQVEEEEGLSFGSSLQSSVQVPLHVRVYKNLVREVIGSKTHMNVPRKIIQADTNDNVMFRLEHVIKREFRADTEPLALTQFYSEKTRQQIAFLALKELQKKLAWAESLGLDLDDDDVDSDEEVDNHDDDDDDDDDRDSSSTSSTKHGSSSSSSSGHMNQLVASDVVPLPDHPPSCYLQPGTFLLAHPLMTGCFARTVICLLQHTPAGKGHGQRSLNDDNDNDDDDDVGGTYGLIVNQPLHVGVPNRNSKKVRCRTLREVIRHDCLPGSVQAAFGDVPVRNGGPVNMSIQMLRCMEKKQDVVDEIRCDFGGCHLTRAATVTVMTGVEKKDAKDEKKKCGNDNGGKNNSDGDNDCSVFFGGDVIKAAQSVLDWDTTQDNFSFVVGASCWEPGQLESEVEKGYWIPCAAPPRIAFSGSCRVKGMDDVHMSESGLWVSMMAAIGEEEGRLAQLFEDVEYDENGFPCDDL